MVHMAKPIAKALTARLFSVLTAFTLQSCLMCSIFRLLSLHFCASVFGMNDCVPASIIGMISMLFVQAHFI